MQTAHLESRWQCLAHTNGPKSFHSAIAYMEHMKDCHPNDFTHSQLSVLAQLTECKDHRIFKECPLCGTIPMGITRQFPNYETWEFQDALQRHVAQHLNRLAMMSIEWFRDDDSSMSGHDNERMRLEEEGVSLEFADPPTPQPVSRGLDDDWKDRPPSNDSLVEDPAWLTFKHGDTGSITVFGEWDFCPSFTPPKLPIQHWQDNSLVQFIGRWLVLLARMGRHFMDLASESEPDGTSKLSHFLDSQDPSSTWMSELLYCAAENEEYGAALSSYITDRIWTHLVNHPTRKPRIDEHLLIAASKNRTAGGDIVAFLMKISGNSFIVTQGMIQAALENSAHVERILTIYSDYDPRTADFLHSPASQIRKIDGQIKSTLRSKLNPSPEAPEDVILGPGFEVRDLGRPRINTPDSDEDTSDHLSQDTKASVTSRNAISSNLPPLSPMTSRIPLSNHDPRRTIPPYLSFVAKIEEIRPNDMQPSRMQDHPQGFFLPPDRRDAYDTRSHYILRFSGGRFHDFTNDDAFCATEMVPYDSATLFSQAPNTDHLLMVPFDARKRNISSCEYGWRCPVFDHITEMSPKTFASVTFVGGEAGLPAHAPPPWSQLIPAPYLYQVTDDIKGRLVQPSCIFAGLIGSLPLLVALAAFSAPPDKLTATMMNSVQGGRWRAHNYLPGR